MKTLRIAIATEEGRLFEDWEKRLFSSIEAHPDLELVANFTVEPRPETGTADKSILRLLALEDRLLPTRRSSSEQASLPDVPQNPTAGGDDSSPAVAHDILLSHVRGNRPSNAAFSGSEIWEYSFNVDGTDRTFGADFVASDSPLTRIQLFLNRPQGREIIATSSTNTKFLGGYNTAYAKDKLVPVVVSALVRRQRQIETVAKSQEIVSTANPPRAGAIRYGVRVFRSVAARTAEKLMQKRGIRHNDWVLLLGKGDALHHPLRELTELPKPSEEFWADPFVFQDGGKIYVFFEACSHRTRLGRICVGRLEGGELHEVRNIDFGPIHTSYPFVFRAEQEVYMVPEVHNRKRVEVWRATRFPYEWELHATALEGRAPVDTTLFAHRGAWWLFTNISSGKFFDPGQELHVFRVDGPDLGNLIEHALNPVVVDAGARNGGRPFIRGNDVYRPAQVSAHGRYGHGLRINRITELSLERYSETTVRTIEPDFSQGTTGCHHLDVSEDLFILDARRDLLGGLRRAQPISLSPQDCESRKSRTR